MSKYKVVGNENYQIDSKRNITRVDGNPSEYNNKDKGITISLYGIIYKVEREWLYWLSYFKLELPKKVQHKITEYRFSKFSDKGSKSDGERIVYFNNPVYIDDEFRIIPRYPRYSINKFGVVKRLYSNYINYPKIIDKKENSKYLFIGIVDQAKIRLGKNVPTHRLMGLTWVHNDDWFNNVVIDHKDDNKSNCIATNLHWVTHKKNNILAVYSGLNKTANGISIRNIKTGEINTFPSMTKACLFMGRSIIDLQKSPLRADKIYKTKLGEYEIKKSNDKREWYYINNRKRLTGDTYRIIITNEDGSIDIYTSSKEFKEKEFTYNGVISLENLIIKFKKEFPNRKITIKKLKNKRLQGIEVKNVKTGIIKRYNNSKLASMDINMPVPNISKLRLSEGRVMFDNYVIRTASLEPWPLYKEREYKNKKIKVIINDIEKNNTFIYNSFREASNKLDISRTRLNTLILHKRIYNGRYKIELLEN